jgi:hypothetical protein
VTIELTFELTRLICFKCACMTSRAEIFLCRRASRRSTARMKQISPEGAGVVCWAMANDGIDEADRAAVVPILRLSRRVILQSFHSWSTRSGGMGNSL